jgi:DNA-binding phage protein
MAKGKVETAPYDVAEHLRTASEIEAYLQEMFRGFNDGEIDAIDAARAVSDAVEARNKLFFPTDEAINVFDGLHRLGLTIHISLE